MSQSPPRSSPAASPAKISQQPEREPVWRGSVPAFGGTSQGSFASYDHESLSWKTFQLCLDGGSETYSETWPRAGTMRAGIAYQQRPSAPLTAVTGSSWSRGEYPTPAATEYGTSQNEGKVPHDRPTKGTPSLHTWARGWPTPTGSDGKGRADGHRGGGPNLRTSAQAWPTPSATDHKGSSKPGQRRRQLAEAALWPTATAGDSKASGSRGIRGDEGNEANEGTSLTDATCRSGRPLPEICTHGEECLPRLNPRFVSWLMGFPLDWIGSWARPAGKRSKPTATP
jgi:hypothetical protein